ncbi:MAG: motility associated factor glycosyltransferase family protein [Colwellia sp.]|nr:motility associated factor glycosyltransferase family protein [Colwellia sp.]
MNQSDEQTSQIPGGLLAAEEQFEHIKHNFSSTVALEEKLQEQANTMSLLVSSDEDLMARYLDNLKAFKLYQPKIYDFFKKFEPKKYIVDANDGFVNAINVETGQLFYEYPSYLSTKLQFDQFKCAPVIKKFNFTPHRGNEAKFIHVESMNKMLDLKQKKNGKPCKPSEDELKNISSLMVFGVGCGYHLELFTQQCDIGAIYIIEPDLDLFFLSLFSINWQYILSSFEEKGTHVHISLGEQKDTFFEELMHKSNLNGRYQMAHVAGYIHYMSPQISDILSIFNKSYLEMCHGWGFFDDAVMSISHMLANIDQKVPILKDSAKLITDVFDIPVFIVGNGPSLDQLIDTIRAYQNKAIVISCGTALSACYKYGLKPDFHCEQERTSVVAETIDASCPASFLEGIVLLASTIVHPTVFAKFKHSIMVPKADEPSSALLLRDEVGKKLFSAYHFMNPTVANTALTAAYHLGFKKLYLFGIDLGHKQGGAHHSTKSLYYSDDNEDKALFGISDAESVEVEGNFGGTFICNHFFYQSNQNLSNQIRGNTDLTCFNLSDGALIEGTIPLDEKLLSKNFATSNQINKQKCVEELYRNAAFHDDDGELMRRISNDLDYELFDDFCHKLIEINSLSVSTFKEATTLLIKNTMFIRSFPQNVYDLISGTIMQMQVVLTQFLYNSSAESEGIKLFNESLVVYCEFLSLAAKYYRAEAETPHYVNESYWGKRLRGEI